MRDQTIMQYVQGLLNMINQLQQQMRLFMSGEAIQNQALKDLLMKKGLITETEWTQAVGEIIQKANAASPEEKKEEQAGLIVPSAQQVAQVEESKVETPEVK